MRRARRALGLALLALAAGGGAAHAEATLEPAGSHFAFAAQSGVTVMRGAAGVVCNLVELTGVNIPEAPGNSSDSGPLTLPFAEAPIFEGCWARSWGLYLGITGDGAWDLEASWGAPPTVGIGAPAGGIHVNVYQRDWTGPIVCEADSGAAATVPGTWQNGVSTDSTVTYEGALELRWTRGAEGCTALFGARLLLSGRAVAVHNVIFPRTLITLGP